MGVVGLVFRCRMVAGTPAPTDEATDVRWLTLDEVSAAMTPAFATRVTDAITDSPKVCAHDGVILLVAAAPT